MEDLNNPNPEESPQEAPATDAPATCPNCGGEMTEGHTCPMPAEGDEEAAVAAEPAEASEGTEAPKKSKTGLIVVVLLLVALGAGYYFFFMKPAGQPAEKPAAVEVVPVDTGAVMEKIDEAPATEELTEEGGGEEAPAEEALTEEGAEEGVEEALVEEGAEEEATAEEASGDGEEAPAEEAVE